MSRPPNQPLKPVAKMLARAEQMDLFDLLEPNEVEEQLMEWLGEPTEEFCRCGKRLVEWETGAGRCQDCREAAEREKTFQEQQVEGRLQKIGVPPRYHHCSLASYSGEPPKEALDWIIRPGGRSLLLWGPDTGSGKTHLGTAALRSLESAGHRCWWASAVDLARMLSLEEFNPEQPTHRKSARVEILMVDDLGVEHGAVLKGSERLEAVLEERYRFHRATILTTNLTPEELFARHPRLASRLNEGVVCEIAGKDRRAEIGLKPFETNRPLDAPPWDVE